MKVLIVVVALFAVFALFLVVENVRVPSGLGVNGGRLASMPNSPNAVSSQTKDREKRVAPFPFRGELEETKEAVRQALSAYGNISVLKEEKIYLHAVSTTPKMRFHDDIEFYFDEKSRLVHFRSSSRVGYSDMGLNRSRYDRLFELYREGTGQNSQQ